MFRVRPGIGLSIRDHLIFQARISIRDRVGASIGFRVNVNLRLKLVLELVGASSY